ncbi:uncharacterized protein LOC132742138 [Ruditapes philippinarum]|uniref:uncharacterized protein LOC132742138 n=1 Tax=Ruditapes philippinarum TaxID=129788 RepID=UPI00295B4DCD|nr:uncharacterized protein LOC132742138 [Ruditapes philippinarum]
MLQLEVLMILLSSVSVTGIQDFYCDRFAQSIMGVTEGRIISRYQDQAFYSNDMSCQWELDALENGRIQLTVENLDLQWNPEYSSCSGYDHLEIFEGSEKNHTHLTSVCHAKNPHSIISTGRYLYMKFTSNHQNFGAKSGIEIKFKTFRDGYCPPSWFQASVSSEDCFMVGLNGQAGWSRAQDICNFNRANLASILSDSEYNAILVHGRNQSAMLTQAWLGLSDRDKDGTYKWIDKHSLAYKRKMTGKRYDTFCIAQDYRTGDWSVLNCDSQHFYICKCKKDGSTVLYQADPPTPPPDEDNKGTKVYLVVIIIVVIIVLACVGSLLFYFCYWRKRTHGSPHKKRDNVGDENTSSNSAGARFTPIDRHSSIPTAPPQENVMLHDFQMVAPPTYEDALSDPISPSMY